MFTGNQAVAAGPTREARFMGLLEHLRRSHLQVRRRLLLERPREPDPQPRAP